MFLVPKEALSYSPDPETILIETPEYVERLIFSDQDYKPWELSALSSLNKLALPSTQTDDSEKLRFLYGAGWNIREASSMISSHHQWHRTWPSYQKLYPEISEILNSGGIYIHGRDIKFRPIVCVSPRLLSSRPIDLLIKSVFYICEYSKEHLFLPGKIENFVLLIDLEDFYFCDVLSTLMNILLVHYPCRLARGFIFNYSRAFQVYLKILSKGTLNKLSFIEENNLFDICNPKQIEKRFGGCAENVTKYWPPNFPSTSFLNPPSLDYLKGGSLISSLKQSGKESFFSASEFKDEIWDKLEVVNTSFSFLNTDVGTRPLEVEDQLKTIQRRGLSEDITRSTNIVKRLSLDNDLIEPGCCVEKSCTVI